MNHMMQAMNSSMQQHSNVYVKNLAEDVDELTLKGVFVWPAPHNPPTHLNLTCYPLEPTSHPLEPHILILPPP